MWQQHKIAATATKGCHYFQSAGIAIAAKNKKNEKGHNGMSVCQECFQTYLLIMYANFKHIQIGHHY